MSKRRTQSAFVIAITVLMLATSAHGACNSPIFSFEGNNIQGWAGGQPPTYSGSASQAAVYAMTNHPTDGQYSLRVAFDYYAGSSTNAVYYVENLNDFSAYSTLNFDIWKSGQPYSLTVALSTGPSWTWYESRAYSISDGQSYMAIDLKSYNWKTASSNWVNNVAVQNLNAVHRISVVLLPNSAGFNEAFLDNFRLCSSSTISTAAATTGSTTAISSTTVTQATTATTAATSSTAATVGTTGAVAITGTSTGSSPTGPPVSSGFVGTSGNIFKVDGCQYYIHGSNCYYVTYMGDVAAQNVLNDCVSMGLNTLRIWAFIDKGSADGSTRYNVDGSGDKNGVYFQYWNTAVTPNTIGYNDGDTGLKRLDYAIDQAKQRGIRLILTLTNNWKDFGGADQYSVWFQKSYHDDFYTNTTIKQAYKNYVAHLVNRVNSYTGVSYRNEPAILAWELINEPRCSNGNLGTSGSCTTATISSWINEMSTYINSIDPNHMISVGDEGFFKNTAYGSDWKYDGSTGDYRSYTSNPYISFGTAHLYPSGWSQDNAWGNSWITQHINDVPTKPFLLEEFGITDQGSRASVYADWFNSLKTGPGAGFTYWMIAGNTSSSLYPDYDHFTVYNDNSGGATAIKNADLYYRSKESSCSPTTKATVATSASTSSSSASVKSTTTKSAATVAASTKLATSSSTSGKVASTKLAASSSTSAKATSTKASSTTK